MFCFPFLMNILDLAPNLQKICPQCGSANRTTEGGWSIEGDPSVFPGNKAQTLKTANIET